MDNESENLKKHPILATLGANASETLGISGYIGEGDAEHVKLHPSLGNPSESVVIAKVDIVHAAPAPEALRPFGGTTVWVKRTAEVTYYRLESARVEVRLLPHSFFKPPSEISDRTAEGGPRFKEIKSGRLHMRVRAQPIQEVCQSVCGNCYSFCCAPISI
jgi:hypothetical protein